MTATRATVVHHLRRYPKWYAVLTAWLLAMALIPVVHHPGAPRVSPGTTANIVGLAPAAPLPAVDSAPVEPLASSPVVLAPVVGPAAAGPDAPAPTPTEGPQPGEEGGLGALLPDLPPLPLPATPAELEPLFNAMAPMMATGCSGIGLAAVVVAVVAPTVEDVPLAELMPYLAPLYSVCAYFPIPSVRTICPIDDQIAAQLPDDLTALVTAPTVIGLGIDEIAGMEAAVLQMTGQTVPPLADSLRQQLGCRIES